MFDQAIQESGLVLCDCDDRYPLRFGPRRIEFPLPGSPVPFVLGQASRLSVLESEVSALSPHGDGQSFSADESLVSHLSLSGIWSLVLEV